MADYFTQFSCSLDVGTAVNAKRALRMLNAMREDDDDPPYGFEAELASHMPGIIYITDSAGQGDPEHVVRFVLACAAKFDLSGRWGFTWAIICMKPLLDGFGGGAQLLDLGARCSSRQIDCAHWLALALRNRSDEAPELAVSSASSVGSPLTNDVEG